jgi:hypothetical protein
MRAALLAVAGLLVTGATGFAQATGAASFEALAQRIHVGQSIWVTDQAGREVRGKLERLTNDTLVVTNERLETFAASEIRRVRARKPDSIKNGALIGLAAGAAMGTAWCIGAVADDSGDIDARVECAEGFIVYPALGTLIGMGFDAATPGRVETIYEAPQRGATRINLTVSPLFTSRKKGLALSFTV